MSYYPITQYVAYIIVAYGIVGLILGALVIHTKLTLKRISNP